MPIIETMQFFMDSCISGRHIYEAVWTAVFDEELPTERQTSNIVDRYVAAMEKDSSANIPSE